MLLFIVGIISLTLGYTIGIFTTEYHKSKKQCYECKRKLSKVGFLINGKKYKCYKIKKTRKKSNENHKTA